MPPVQHICTASSHSLLLPICTCLSYISTSDYEYSSQLQSLGPTDAVRVAPTGSRARPRALLTVDERMRKQPEGSLKASSAIATAGMPTAQIIADRVGHIAVTGTSRHLCLDSPLVLADLLKYTGTW